MAKYASKVTPEHRAAMQAIGVAHLILSQHRETYEQFLRSEEFMHNAGGLLDPTLYRDMLYSKNFELSSNTIAAALAFMRAIDAVKRELKCPPR